MNINREDLKKYIKVYNGVEFYPKFTYLNFNDETNIYEDCLITKTAEETYQEWLNPSTQEPTLVEKQAQLIDNLILANLNMQTQIDSLITNNLGGN